MKPKTKSQKRAVEISAKLRPLTEKQLSWAISNCLENFAKRKATTLECLECGHVWKDESYLVASMAGCECPGCGLELTVKGSARNPHYVCPTDLKAAHDKYLEKKIKLQKLKKEEQHRLEI